MDESAAQPLPSHEPLIAPDAVKASAPTLNYKDSQRATERELRRVIVPTVSLTDRNLIGLASGREYLFSNGTRRNRYAKLDKEARRKRRRILAAAQASIAKGLAE